MKKPLAIIGMSPGNSYFKDYEVRFLLKEAVERFGRCATMVADVPAISTYMAYGYAENKARRKAIPKGNNLKNRTRRIAEELGYGDDIVSIFDWAEEVETSALYKDYYSKTLELYESNPAFKKAVRDTTAEVLENSNKLDKISDKELDCATHYLLSEIAFLEFAPKFFEVERICYLYHRNWQVYEDYIRGKFDGKVRDHLDFLLLEAPYETYIKLHDEEIDEGTVLHDTYSRVMQSGVLRAAYIDYPPVFYKTEEGKFSGLFYEIISGFAKEHNLDICWVEERGYGVVVDGVQSGQFDIFCSATWPTAGRQKGAILTKPLYYSDVGVWVREDSPYVDKDWIELDDPGCAIAMTEGDISHDICLTNFVQSKWVRVPQLKRVKGLLDSVADGKADATMVERVTYEAYKKQLATPLINIAANKPVRRFSNSFLIGKDQDDFLTLINDYVTELISGDQFEEKISRALGGLEGVTLKRIDK